MIKTSKQKQVSKRKIISKDKSMFYEPARHQKLSDIVKLTSIPEAKIGARELKKEFRFAKSKKKKIRVRRATNLAANRADAMARKRNLKSKTKVRLRKVSRIYRKAHDEMGL
jgi:hypothetical protein